MKIRRAKTETIPFDKVPCGGVFEAPITGYIYVRCSGGVRNAIMIYGASSIPCYASFNLGGEVVYYPDAELFLGDSGDVDST